MSTRRLVVLFGSLILAAIVAGIVLFVVVSNNAAHERGVERCADEWPAGSMDYFMCVERID